MTFPVIATVATGAASAGATTAPASVASGDLLICFLTNNGDSSTWTPPSGFTELSAARDGIPLVWSKVYYKISDGTEGSTYTFTNAGGAVYVNMRITGAHASTAPEAANSNGTATGSDPPNLTPAGGSQDYLWIECSYDVIGAFPSSSYGSSGYTDEANTSNAGVAAYKNATATSENPGVMANSGTAGWLAYTIAVYPAAAAAAAAAPAYSYLALLGVG